MNHYATSPNNGPLPRHYYLAKRFKEYGYKVCIFASNQLHATDTEVSTGKEKYAEVEENGIKFFFLKTMKYKGNGVKRILNMLSFKKALVKVWKKIAKKYGKPDIVLGSSAHLFTCVSALKIAKKNKIPCISEVRDLWPEELFTVGKVKEKSFFGKVLLRLERKIYEKSDALVFTKEGDVDHIKEMKWDIAQGGKIDLNKCNYINNGVDFDEWNANIKNHVFPIATKPVGKFYVGYAGSIRPMNNVELLIETAELMKNDKSIVFYIAGAGSLLESLKQMAKEKELDNIVFTGYMDKRMVPSFLSNMDLNILVYSDTKYNWSRGNSSNKLFEYMASGKPIISTVKTGYSIIDRYKCGVEIAKCDAAHLSEAILKMKELNKNDYDTYCLNSLKASKDFDFDKLSKDYISLVEKLIKKD